MGFVDDAGLELGKRWRRKETDTDAYTGKSTRKKGKKEYPLQSAVVS